MGIQRRKSPQINNNLLETQTKMSFIFTAVMNGWDIEKINEKTYTFTKPIVDIENGITVERMVKDFVKASLSINYILNAQI